MRMSEYECKKCDDGWKSEQNQTDNTVHCVLIEEVNTILILHDDVDKLELNLLFFPTYIFVSKIM